jgi:hypothetical protein
MHGTVAQATRPSFDIRQTRLATDTNVMFAIPSEGDPQVFAPLDNTVAGICLFQPNRIRRLRGFPFLQVLLPPLSLASETKAFIYKELLLVRKRRSILTKMITGSSLQLNPIACS